MIIFAVFGLLELAISVIFDIEEVIGAPVPHLASHHTAHPCLRKQLKIRTCNGSSQPLLRAFWCQIYRTWASPFSFVVPNRSPDFTTPCCAVVCKLFVYLHSRSLFIRPYLRSHHAFNSLGFTHHIVNYKRGVVYEGLMDNELNPRFFCFTTL